MEAALPPTAQVIADVIGRDATLALARAAKCRSVYIPQRLPRSHWLRSVVGENAAEMLSEEFPGITLPLAKCAGVVKAERNRIIAELSARGMKQREIGRRLGIPESTVQTVLYRMRQRQRGSE